MEKNVARVASPWFDLTSAVNEAAVNEAVDTAQDTSITRPLNS